MKFKKYTEYKDSGIEWIGEVPKDYKSKKLKYVFSLNKGKNPSILELEKKNDKYKPYLAMDYLRGNNTEPLYAIPERNSVLVKEDDILVLWDGSNAGVQMRNIPLVMMFL